MNEAARAGITVLTRLVSDNLSVSPEDAEILRNMLDDMDMEAVREGVLEVKE